MSNLEAALSYLRLGWSIFPLKPPTKTENGKPRVQWAELQKQLPTETQVRKWWTDWPDAGIALATGRLSGVVAVDIDPRHDGTTEGLPETGAIARTGGGGEHWLYAYPEGVSNVDNQVNNERRPMPYRGRDVRGDGGYIILSPSTHYTGRRYEWVRFNPSKLGKCPTFALKPYRETSEGRDSQDKWLAGLIAEGTRPGQRNDDLARFGGYLASKGIPLDVGLELASLWMRDQGTPLPKTEVDVTIRSVYKTESRRNPQRKVKNARAVFPTLTLNQFMNEYGENEVRWIVDGWLPESTIGFIVSPPGGFKTWMTFDLAVSIASGQPFLGHYATNLRGPVLLVQQEDYNRQTAARNALIILERTGREPPILDGDHLIDIPAMPSDDELPLHYHAERALRWSDTAVMDALEEFIKAVRPIAVIVDPFYSTTETDEYMAKAASDMSRLKSLRDQYGTSFMLVHHTRKNSDWGREKLWGSQFLNAFSETQWQIRRREGEDFNITQRFFKVDGSQDFVRADFDIDEKAYRYKVKTSEVSREDAENLIAGKTKDTEERGKVYPKGLARRVAERLAADGPMSLSVLTLSVGSSEDKVADVLRKLAIAGDAREDENGQWHHTVPSFT